MKDKLEKLISEVYKRWKLSQKLSEHKHPDEEDLVCFLEGKLPDEEVIRIKEHIIKCERCLELISLEGELKKGKLKEMPQDLIEWTKSLQTPEDKQSMLELILRLKQKALEIISTNGDVLVGQELVPAPILRSRRIEDFRDEVNVLKDFKDIRVEIKIENKIEKTFNVIIIVKYKPTQKVLKDLRVTLIKDDLELESYLSDSGSVVFEHVQLGKYTVAISSVEERIASVLLDIRA